MQYILSEEEYSALITKGKKREVADKELIQKLCTLCAEHIPVTPYWNKDDKSYIPEPWGCILTKGGNGCGYCDDCPVQDDCPYDDKDWSK